MLVAANDLRPVFFWSFVLIGLVIGGYFLVSLVKKKLKEPDEARSVGFTLADLRELHRAGKMSTEEFERAKTKITASMRAAMERDARLAEKKDARTRRAAPPSPPTGPSEG